MTTEGDLTRILDEVFDRFVAPPLGPGEFTRAMFAERYRLSRQQAEGAILRGLTAGQLVEVGKRRSPYRRIAMAYKLIAPPPAA